MTTWTISKDGVEIKSITLSDSAAADVAAWAIDVRKGSIQEGDTMRDPTPVEAVALQAADFFNDLLSRATAWKRDQAAKAAAEAVKPIEPA